MKKKSIKPNKLILTKVKISKLDRLNSIRGGGCGTGSTNTSLTIATQEEDTEPLLP